MNLYTWMLIVVFFAAVLSLFSGLYFLLKDTSQRHRTANALLIRVTLCGLLIVLIIYGIYGGYIHPHSPVGLLR